MYFCYFIIIASHPSFEQTFIPITQGYFVPSVVKIGPASVSGGRLFLNFVNVFLLFRDYLPLKMGVAFHFNKLIYPSPKNALCQVWLKLGEWFWK